MPLQIAKDAAETIGRACRTISHRWTAEERLRRQAQADAMQSHLANSLGLSLEPALAKVPSRPR